MMNKIVRNKVTFYYYCYCYYYYYIFYLFCIIIFTIKVSHRYTVCLKKKTTKHIKIQFVQDMLSEGESKITSYFYVF